jgi:hypothetical protein
MGLKKIRIGFRGLGPANTDGDTWHTKLIGSAVGSMMYNWNETRRALRDLLEQVDKDSDRRIESSDVEDLDLGIHGFSQGGVSAIDLTRTIGTLGIFGLPIEKGRIRDEEGWLMCVEIPVKTLVTIDPASFALIIPYPKKNVEKVVNYYQRRGGHALYYRLDASGNITGDPLKFGNFFSALIKGNSIGGRATDNRIDTRAGHRDGIFGSNTRIYAKDVNHDTIPWYVAPEAASDLQ